MAAASDNYTERTTRDAEVARSYLDAYFGKRWDRLRDMGCVDLTFDDPSSASLFGGAGHHAGRDTVVGAFEKALAPVHLAYAEGEVVAAIGEWRSIGWLKSSMPFGLVRVESTVPIVIELSLATEDGRTCVRRHRDIVDYRPFLKAIEAASKRTKQP